MKGTSRLLMAIITVLVVWGLASLLATRMAAQQTSSKPAVTAEQQKQLDRLQELEKQLEADRDELHAAITEHGWDSEEADKAQEKLLRDRNEYRGLRRALNRAGVQVPPPSGFRAGPMRGEDPGYGYGYGPGRRGGRGGGRGYGYGYGYGPHCPCPCW